MKIFGVGNPYRGDDGAGIHAARELRARVPPGVDVIEVEGDLAAVLDAFRGEREVVLIDAVRSGRPAGSVVRIDAHAESVPAAFSRSSTHSFGVAEAVELARTLGTLPRHVVLYGIEGEFFAAGDALSPDVRRAVSEVVDRVLEEVGAGA